MTNAQIHQPKVSILIPVFNRKNYIAECIQSALDQTFTDFEVVVVDNASEDGTWEICQRFADKDQRVRIYRNEINIGPVRNWLACVEQAQGEYGKILFSDDLIFPKFLEHALPHLERPEIGFVLTAILYGDTIEHGVAVDYSENSNEGKNMSSEHYFELMLNANAPYSPGAAIFRMADIRANLLLSFPTCLPRDFTKNGAGPDVLLYALTALNYKKVTMLSTVDVFFRTHPDSFSVANQGNEVTKGYQTALAWFCHAKLGPKFWTRYIAKIWLLKVRGSRRITSLTKFCSENEGRGGLIEALAVLVAAVRMFVKPNVFARGNAGRR